MISSLHLQFDDGTQVCVPSHEACFYIEKFAADGCALERVCSCVDCSIRPAELHFAEVFADARISPTL